jgi:hypothetical protein
MLSKIYRILLAVAPLLLMAACAGGNSDHGVSVSIQAEFEKRTITASGLSNVTYEPARYCWVEGFDPQTDTIYFSGYLGSTGLGITDVPRNANFKVRLIARYEVPVSNNSGSFRMRGSVKNGALAAAYNDVNAFNAIPDWSVLSDTYTTASRDLNIKITASDSTLNREAGAFNIADQAVEFASKIAELEPGLSLPNLHSFWSQDNQYTDYPRVAYDRQNRILAQLSDRTVFQHKISGTGNFLTEGRADEYNDSALIESFAHMLFADYSYPCVRPSHPYDRVIRRDSEEIAWVDREIASESTTAFVNGFCDFISATFRNSPLLTDIYPDDIYSYNLNAITTFPKTHGGGFYRQSVAAVLYRIWANAFGGTTNGLRTMWDATYQQGMATGISNAVYPYGYLQCPVGNISSYLSGLANGAQSGVTTAIWNNSILNALSSESMGNPNANYFNQEIFWKKISGFPATETGTIRTYADADGIYWDIDQAKSYHFTQPLTGNRKITLELTGGQDLFLELFDDMGILEESTDNSGSVSREINLVNLKPGNYVVRVRAGNTTQNRLAAFKLTIQ